jgi:hypothetical protein
MNPTHPHDTRQRESLRDRALRHLAAQQPSPYPPLDLRSEPVFPNGPPPDEQEPGDADAAWQPETPPEIPL